MGHLLSYKWQQHCPGCTYTIVLEKNVCVIRNANEKCVCSQLEEQCLLLPLPW